MSADFLEPGEATQETTSSVRCRFYLGGIDGMASCDPRVKEASTGYFYDLHMTRLYGGKTWMAPQVLIREDVRLP
jgi:hypothetical protein